MRVRYDHDTDILYIRFKEKEITDSEEVDSGFIIDYAADGTPVGLEILDAHKRKGIDPFKVELDLLPDKVV